MALVRVWAAKKQNENAGKLIFFMKVVRLNIVCGWMREIVINRNVESQKCTGKLAKERVWFLFVRGSFGGWKKEPLEGMRRWMQT